MRARRRAKAWPPATSSTRLRGFRAQPPSTASLRTRRPTAPRARQSTIARRKRSRPRARPTRSRLGGRRGSRALRSRRRPRGAHRLVGRERELSARQGRLRARPPRANAAAPHPRRRPGDRQEPARLRARRSSRRRGAHHLAPGTLSRVRRRNHLLGAERDRQGTGGDPRTETPRDVEAEKLRRRVVDVLPGRADAAGSSRIARARRPDAESELGGDRRRAAFPPGGASSRSWPHSARSSSSSRISTGRTRACSTSSTSSSTG